MKKLRIKISRWWYETFCKDRVITIKGWGDDFFEYGDIVSTHEGVVWKCLGNERYLQVKNQTYVPKK